MGTSALRFIFGGLGKAPISESRTAFSRDTLGACRVVEGRHATNIALCGSVARMNESIGEIERLLREIVVHLQAGTTADARKAVAKLERIAALASTLALTIQATRR
jgi:hypothetical protein